MEKTIFSKMRVRSVSRGLLLNAPAEYPPHPFAVQAEHKGGGFDFVHLFVADRAQYARDFPGAAARLGPDGLFWVSYPKGRSTIKTDINRNSLWDLSIPLGFHPVAQISLDETWSAVRMKPNETGVSYRRPQKSSPARE